MDRFYLYAKNIMKKINNKNFKKTLSKFMTGVTVICVERNKKIFGKTVNSFSSLSLNPPLILFALGIKSSSLSVFLESNYLTVNILSNKQKKISEIFSKNEPEINKIEFDKINRKSYISNCLANLEVKLIDKIKKGDHIIFICKVMKVNHNDKLKPLSYFNSKYIK